jgi:hypothetical protein
MHCVDLLEEAIKLAQDSGYEVRQEWLGERGGGVCRIGDNRVLFVDLSLTAQEQLEQTVKALDQSDPNIAAHATSSLARYFSR